MSTETRTLNRGGTIRNWNIVGGRIFGIIFGDPRFADGDDITTTSIQNIRNEANLLLCDTKNTTYILEKFWEK